MFLAGITRGHVAFCFFLLAGSTAVLTARTPASASGLQGGPALGVGARAEVAAGQSPESGLSEGEAAVLTELRLSAGMQFRGPRDTATLRYAPRLLYRPGTFERPLVLHQLLLARESELSRRVRLSLGADAVLGELEQGVLSRQALGETNAGVEANSFGVFSTSAFAGLEYDLTAISDLTLGLRGGYATSSEVAVLPGLRASSANVVPESASANSSIGYGRRLTRRLRFLFQAQLDYFTSSIVGSMAAETAVAGTRYLLSRQSSLTTMAGVTYAQLPAESQSNVPLFPVASVILRHTFHEDASGSSTGNLSLEHSGSFDTFQGDYRPQVEVQAGGSHRNGRWTIAASLRASFITAAELRDNDARGSFAGEVPVSYQLSDEFELSFGARASARSEEWPLGPLRPRQVEALGFVALKVVVSDREDPGWIL